MQMRRIKWIDNARTIGILLIIIGHTVGGIFGPTIQNVIFTVNVSIFFFISGYLHREKPIKKVIKSGFENLLLPYIITSILMIAFSMIAINCPNRLLNLYFPTFTQGIIAALYGVGTSVTILGAKPVSVLSIGAIWFLPCMFIANIIYTLLKIILNKLHLHKVAATVIFLTLSGVGFSLTMEYNLFLPWSIPAALVSLLFYWGGDLAQQYDLLYKKNRAFFILSILVWVLSAKMGYFWFNIATAAYPPIAMIGSLAGCYTICYFSFWIEEKFDGFSNRFIKLGELSLIVLCTHILDLNNFRFIHIVNKFCALFQINSLKIYAIGSIIYRIIFALLSVFIIPKIPVLRSFFMYRQYPFGKRKSKRRKYPMSK
jgi:fucose 4-O-acetylase-like acetyltransferase